MSGEDRDSILAPGQKLDRYELLTPIASGGMATVWLARLLGKRGFEKLVAIKTIRTEFSDDPAFEEMFLDEARIASGIQHPNVAQISDLGEERGVLYIVMEYVDGESLAKLRKAALRKKEPIPLGVALRILADACAGLHAAHELRDQKGEPLGIVHRDISPHNILVSSTGVVKVIDFGIAKAKNRMAKETGTGVVKGKVAYMAREQAMGGEVDRRVDLWAIGVCLYELVAGRLPFDGDNQLEVFQNVISLEKRPQIDGATPAIIDDILDRALARLPEERYRTAAAMERALEDAIQTLELDGSTEAVADFVQANLFDRFAKRQELVNRALESAARRMPTRTGRSDVELVTADLHALTPPPSFEEAETVAATKPIPLAQRAAKPAVDEHTNVPIVDRAVAKEPPRRSPLLPWILVVAAAGAVFVWRERHNKQQTPVAAAPTESSAPSASISVSASASAAPAPSPSPSPSVSLVMPVPPVPSGTPQQVATQKPHPVEPAPSPSAPATTEPPPPLPDEDDPYQ